MFSAKEIEFIRQKYMQGEPTAQLAVDFGTTLNRINDIVNGNGKYKDYPTLVRDSWDKRKRSPRQRAKLRMKDIMRIMYLKAADTPNIDIMIKFDVSRKTIEDIFYGDQSYTVEKMEKRFGDRFLKQIKKYWKKHGKRKND